MPTKYGPKAQTKVKKVMHEFKAGTLKSGSSGKKVRSRKQAVAIALSEARASGAKVPKATAHRAMLEEETMIFTEQESAHTGFVAPQHHFIEEQQLAAKTIERHPLLNTDLIFARLFV